MHLPQLFFYWISLALITISSATNFTAQDGSFEDNSSTKHSKVQEEPFQCPGPGWYSDHTDPTVYYVCYLDINNELVYYFYNCPTSTCFDSDLRECTAEKCDITAPVQFQCLKQNLAQNAELICEDETLDLLSKSLEYYIDAAATRGRPFNNYRLSVRDVHLQMRANYGKLIQDVGQNIFPLIVATDSDGPDLSGVGGAYKLYHRNGSMERIVPVPAAFELNKCLSHTVLGIFATIAPFFRSPDSITWQPAIRSFQQTINNALYALDRVSADELPLEDSERARTMLTMSNDFLSNCLLTNSVDHLAFQRFANQLAPLIDESMAQAAKVHASYTIPALLKWKAELGEDWKNAYVIIPTVWPVSQRNIRFQMFEKVMNFEQIKKKVLIVEGARSEDDARTTLGRVVTDRALAQLVFGGLDEQSMRDHAFSLSTRRDLLSTATGEALDDYCENELPGEEERCPVARLMASMLRTV